MRAANRFLMGLGEKGVFTATSRVQIELFGSLALTGIGHGTDKAVLLGLEGYGTYVANTDMRFSTLQQCRNTLNGGHYHLRKE